MAVVSGTAWSDGGHSDSLDSNTQPELDEVRRAVVGGLRLYQILISSQDAPGCNFQPSCSRFGQQSVARYGLEGFLMTADRLQRCNGLSPHSYDFDASTGLLFDPVWRNTLWQGDRSLPHPRPASSAPRSLGNDYPPAATPALGPDNIRRFADYLSSRGDYYRAAAEYERYLFTTSGSEMARDSIRLVLGKCLRRAGNTERAARHFRAVAHRQRATGLGCSALRQLAFTDCEQGRFDEAVDVLTASAVADEVPCAPDAVRMTLGITYMLKKDWTSAKQILEQTKPWSAAVSSTDVSELLAIADEGEHLVYKSPTKAALLSVVIPGSGKIGVGRTKDGIFSFTIVAATVLLAVEGFADGGSGSAQGWIFGALAAGFYAGNIYGSAVAARNQNRAAEEDVYNRATALGITISFRL
ncbi:MAG: membrane protein insertion efficiency factor YidD [Candidatus Krumholzibacteria bacterium]